MTSTRPHFVKTFDQINRSHVTTVGGKGANLGELSRVDDVHVPPGFCVTTEAFTRSISNVPRVDKQIDRLARVAPEDQAAIRMISAEIRQTIEQIAIPQQVLSEITDALAHFNDQTAFAVRSSATTEDSPTVSFAGQHDSYLNIIGGSAVLDHIRRCWASLFTERAVAYRRRNDIDHQSLDIAVIVQKMATPSASGVMFTADPVTSDRTIIRVEACIGLGEALVSGLVNADVFKVRDGAVVDKSVGAKSIAIRPLSGGGTAREELDSKLQVEPALTDAAAVQLAALGRQIEAHFGCPQDIEWCFTDGYFEIVQSRPITTLFPIPPAIDDANHVYVSVGHGQMMTDAMKPLGLSFWQMTTPAPMSEAGGRLFVDVTMRLTSPSSRAALLDVFGKADPLMRDALQTILDREGFVRLSSDDAPVGPQAGVAPALIGADPSVVEELINDSNASLAACQGEIQNKSGTELFDFIATDMQELRRILHDPRSYQVFMTAIEATQWINEHIQTWLGETNVADILTQSVSHNVTSEMGLALLDIADVIRPHSDVVAFLGHVRDDNFLDELDKLHHGPEARAVIEGFLDKYGMRCVGEIDITRPRWRERPATLLPLILAHVKNMEPGAAQRRFAEGQQEAAAMEHRLLEQLRSLPDGDEKAAETKRMIDRVRTFIGYREYPKYGMVSRYFVYKQAMLMEAERLVSTGVLREKEDIFFLRFEELHDVVRGNLVDNELIEQRKEAFHSYEQLRPPRVLTSDGEAVHGTYRRDDVPSGALVGLAVSAGTVEGRARIVFDMADADLEPGDILVTAYTDPSWTPLFVGIAGLVTEVGGVMTHGAVIAREYGLPAVVGVERATERIHDGQRIRVHGTDGYVTLLPAAT